MKTKILTVSSTLVLSGCFGGGLSCGSDEAKAELSQIMKNNALIMSLAFMNQQASPDVMLKLGNEAKASSDSEKEKLKIKIEQEIAAADLASKNKLEAAVLAREEKIKELGEKCASQSVPEAAKPQIFNQVCTKGYGIDPALLSEFSANEKLYSNAFSFYGSYVVPVDKELDKLKEEEVGRLRKEKDQIQAQRAPDVSEKIAEIFASPRVTYEIADVIVLDKSKNTTSLSCRADAIALLDKERLSQLQIKYTLMKTEAGKLVVEIER